VRVSVGAPAAEELNEAVRWYETRRPGLGTTFLDAVDSVIGRIRAHPEIGAATASGETTRRVPVTGFPFQVVYYLRPTEIVVVAVAHLKRRPRYWHARF
jgi:plasmid stabilization system protein ParE